ncbi:MAG: hypothetical protein IJ588_11025 [Prevotella sp.]|nr:hypothetical protein [Prevotella sp.]
MRKHFLLLFLMALLPLAGWALDLSDVYQVRLSYPQADHIYYNAQDRSGIAWNIEVQMEADGAWTAINLEDVALTYHATADGDDLAEGSVKNAGTYYVGIAASGLAYEGAVPENKRPTFEIEQIPLTIVAQNATKVYGESDPATLQWAVKAGQTLPEPAENIAVTFNYARTTAVTPENVRQQEKVNESTGYPLTVTATATNYTITAEGPSSAANPVLFITPKLLTVNYGNTSDANYADGVFTKTFGADNSTVFTATVLSNVTYEGFVTNLAGTGVNDDKTRLTGTITPVQTTTDANVTSAGAALSPAVAPYTIDFSSSTLAATDGNYTIRYAPRTMKIKQVDIAAEGFFFQRTAATQSQTYTYNGEVQGPEYEVYVGTTADPAKKLTENSDYTLTINENDGVAKNHGEYTVKLQGKGNYGGTIDAVEAFAFEIQKKTLNVVVLDETKVYNGTAVAEPETGWRVSYSGFVGDENEDMTGFQKATVSIEDAAANVKDGGYVIKLTQPDSENANYTLSLTNGKFTVTPLTGVKVKASAKSKTYGTADNTGVGAFALEIDASGTAPVNETDRTALTNLANIQVTRDANVKVNGGTENVGLYPSALVPSWTEAGMAQAIYKNYNPVTFVSGDFTINKAKVTIITIGDQKNYGTSDNYVTEAGVQGTSSNMAVTGQKEGDAIGDVIKTYPKLVRAAGEDVGYYDITIEEGTLELTDNYDIENVEYSYGRLKINPIALTIAPLEQAVPVQATGTPALNQSAITYEGLLSTDNITDIDYTVAYSNNEQAFTTQTTVENGIKITIPETPAAGKKNKNYIITATATANLVITNGSADLYLNADDVNLATKIATNNGKTVNVKIKLNRGASSVASYDDKWRAFQWNALVLPFDVTVKQVSQAFGYAIVNVVNPAAATRYASGTAKVAFKLKMDNVVIPANTPFMVKTYDAVAQDAVVNFGSHEIKAPANAAALETAASTAEGLNFKFIGTYEKVTMNNTKSDYQFMINSETVNKLDFVRSDSPAATTFDIVPYNAYFYAPAATNGARAIEISFEEADGSTTVIRNFSVENSEVKADGWYNLNGVRLEGAPTQKGIYINNGKKVIIK